MSIHCKANTVIANIHKVCIILLEPYSGGSKQKKEICISVQNIMLYKFNPVNHLKLCQNPGVERSTGTIFEQAVQVIIQKRIETSHHFHHARVQPVGQRIELSLSTKKSSNYLL